MGYDVRGSRLGGQPTPIPPPENAWHCSSPVPLLFLLQHLFKLSLIHISGLDAVSHVNSCISRLSRCWFKHRAAEAEASVDFCETYSSLPLLEKT